MPGNDFVPREWQAPNADATEQYKLGWLRENTEQGAVWVQEQRGSADWRQSLDCISGTHSTNGNPLTYRSQLSGHRLKTNIRTMIAGLANIRPMWGFNAADAYKDYALALNKVTWALYLEGCWDQSIKEALAYAAATCTGWIRPVYRRDITGRGTIELLTYGQPCVLPVQLPASGDYQRAYNVTLLDEVPIYEAHWRFPFHQDRLKPTTSKYWYASEIRKAAKQNALKRAMDWFRRSKGERLTDQYIPIRWTTINDASVNNTGQRRHMGDPGSSWEYEVPYYGEDLPGGRKADENDARLYPNRRLMISSEECLMYDGPAFSWHGQLDLVPFTLDKWPWEPMGFGLAHDGWQLAKALDEIDRGNMDKVNALQNMPLAYNINAVTEPEARAFDPLDPSNVRIGYDGDATDEPFKPAVPQAVYEIHPETLKMRQILIEELDYLFQTRDIVELSKAKALGKNMDSLEQLIASQGPIVTDMSRGMEKPMSMVGCQVGSLILQYLPTGRLMQYVGPEGLGMEVFDYNPSSIVPSHLPSDSIHDAATQDVIPSKSTPQQRAKWFSQNVRFWIMPHSLHELHQMTQRLMLMQLRQRGYQISGATVMESCNVPSVKRPDGSTEQERFWAEKEDEIIRAARLAVITQVIGAEQGLGGGPPPPGGGKPNGSGHKGGRPPSGQAPPQLKTKGDGRPIISESQ
jgi:hypothetical protein